MELNCTISTLKYGDKCIFSMCEMVNTAHVLQPHLQPMLFILGRSHCMQGEGRCISSNMHSHTLTEYLTTKSCVH